MLAATLTGKLPGQRAIVLPFSTGGHVVHTYYDQVSVLKFIERNWDLDRISDRSRDNLPNPIMAEDNAYCRASCRPSAICSTCSSSTTMTTTVAGINSVFDVRGARRQQSQRAPRQRPVQQCGTPDPYGATGTRSRPTHVLVVDDDSSIQHMLRDYLEHHDMRVVSALQRQEVTRQFATGEPCVAVLELRLGQEDGLDLLREIRSRSDVPVIIISGHRRDEIDRVVGLDSAPITI